MATGVDGRPLASAAKHVGLGYSSGSGFVAVLRLDQGAMTALVRNTRRKAATDRNVQVGECVYWVATWGHFPCWKPHQTCHL